MLLGRQEIPSKLLSQYKSKSSVENIIIKVNLRSKKWFLSCSYNPNLFLLNNQIQNKSRGLDFYFSKYDSFIVLGDFNAETWNCTISEFCATYNLKRFVNPHMHEIFLQRYYMKWVPGDPLKEMIN